MPADGPDGATGDPPGDGRTVVLAGVGETLGTALAHAFADAGDRVALVARTPDLVESLAEELRANGREALALTADVTDPGAVDDAAAAVRSAYGGADVLVHNASAPGSGSLAGTDPDDFERPWRVRAYGGFLLARAFAPDLDGGAILFSGTSFATEPAGRPAWDSAAAATRGLARSLAHDLGDRGVHVAYLAIGAGIAPPDGYVTGDWVAAAEVADRMVALADADASGWTVERVP